MVLVARRDGEVDGYFDGDGHGELLRCLKLHGGNRTYTVTPVKCGYAFTPASQSIKVSNANKTANFSSTHADVLYLRNDEWWG